MSLLDGFLRSETKTLKMCLIHNTFNTRLEGRGGVTNESAAWNQQRAADTQTQGQICGSHSLQGSSHIYIYLSPFLVTQLLDWLHALFSKCPKYRGKNTRKDLIRTNIKFFNIFIKVRSRSTWSTGTKTCYGDLQINIIGCWFRHLTTNEYFCGHGIHHSVVHRKILQWNLFKVSVI